MYMAAEDLLAPGIPQSRFYLPGAAWMLQPCSLSILTANNEISEVHV